MIGNGVLNGAAMYHRDQKYVLSSLVWLTQNSKRQRFLLFPNFVAASETFFHDGQCFFTKAESRYFFKKRFRKRECGCSGPLTHILREMSVVCVCLCSMTPFTKESQRFSLLFFLISYTLSHLKGPTSPTFRNTGNRPSSILERFLVR